MTELVEGLGSAVEGTLTAKAVEPVAGEAGGNTHGAAICANCHAPLTGPYCSQCGQKGHIHRTLSAIGHDLMHGVLHLDGKLAHTLPLLAFKPGRLTRRYIAGERAKFVSPMAMFLFSVFAMFAVFQMVGIGVPSSINAGNGLRQVMQTAQVEAEQERAEAQAALSAATSETERTKAQAQLAQIEADLSEFKGADDFGLGDTTEIKANLTGIESVDQGIVKKWRENPGLMLYKLQANGYKFSWLLIPLSIPFVWLLFAWRRGHKAYDHAVFVTYSLAFMSLLFITVSLAAVSPLGVGWAILIFALGAPVHVYKHLKNTYQLSRISAIWRFVALFVFINVVLVLFLQTLLLLGAF